MGNLRSMIGLHDRRVRLRMVDLMLRLRYGGFALT
ncbi:hypothetical protein AAW51_4009 [Caldimonas brevitalea]|uniref:Uncharacterized protein n=1 Tax=Caldimonas brevitalea TaxID=413882 RepID=A0A0G3BVZ3_9BURK|nr:hypothetical protein AAW51_4009 [Caldimonas brevitalea]